MLTAGVSSAASAEEFVTLWAAAAGVHIVVCPAGQIVKVTELLEPPPPPPLHEIVHPVGGGDGGLETVMLATKLVVPELASQAAGILA
jgi:hypothetical protein